LSDVIKVDSKPEQEGRQRRGGANDNKQTKKTSEFGEADFPALVAVKS